MRPLVAALSSAARTAGADAGQGRGGAGRGRAAQEAASGQGVVRFVHGVVLLC